MQIRQFRQFLVATGAPGVTTALTLSAARTARVCAPAAPASSVRTGTQEQQPRGARRPAHPPPAPTRHRRTASSPIPPPRPVLGLHPPRPGPQGPEWRDLRVAARGRGARAQAHGDAAEEDEEVTGHRDRVKSLEPIRDQPQTDPGSTTCPGQGRRACARRPRQSRRDLVIRPVNDQSPL